MTPAGAAGTDTPATEPTTTHRWRTLLLVGGGYLVLSLFIWSNIWTGHPASTTICGCGDSAGAIWVIEWPAYAIAHGVNPFFSTAMGHPGGFNLLSNASALAIGIPLVPVTWRFGPVATLNVALALCPVFSALAMFVLIRRWVSWVPAAFLGGLFFGFSPFVLVELTGTAINLGMLVVPPLVFVCLDELLIRQRRRPAMIGILLGLLVMLQFFISTEVLLMTAVVATIVVVFMVAYGADRHREYLRQHARHALVGLAAGLMTALALLAYPVWFALAGPAHLSGPIWGVPTYLFAGGADSGTTLQRFVTPSWSTAVFSASAHDYGGYLGPSLSWQYFGIGVVVVVIGGCVVWRRDRRLWVFGAVVLVSAVLSLGSSKDIPLPWAALENQPLFENIFPSRFVLFTYLAVAVMLGLVVDHTYQGVNRWRGRARGGPPEGSHSQWRSQLPRWTGAAVAAAVAAVAIVPPAAYLAQTIPITTQRVVLPTWFRTVAPHLTRHQVLLVFPADFNAFYSPVAWQAVDRMSFSKVGAVGPGASVQRAGKEGAAEIVLAAVSNPASGVDLADGASAIRDLLALQQALKSWGVTMVVIPDQPRLPAYDQTASVTIAAALVTAATGERPVHQASAWVWRGVNHLPRPPAGNGVRLFQCTRGVAFRGVAAVDAATQCVLDTTAASP